MESIGRLMIHIVTWNSARYLPDLFHSLRGQSSDAFAITIVDNASTDGTLEWLRDHEPDVTVLRNYRNLGFARAHNQAIALTRSRSGEGGGEAPFIFILNPDIVLDRDCILHIIDFMESHPDVGMAGPKLLRAKRVPSDEGTAFERTNIIDSTGLVASRGRRFMDRGAGEEDVGAYDDLEPFGVSGAAMVLRESAVRKLASGDEVFDEDFFSYKEDVDLSWRHRLLGGKASVIPKAVAWHDRGARPDGSGWFAPMRSQMRHGALVNLLSNRNQRWLEWKNDDTVNRLLSAPWVYAASVARIASAPFVPGALRAFAEAWLGRRRMKAKRRAIFSHRERTPADMRTWFH
jgi:GT2 family glycosyltransferase